MNNQGHERPVIFLMGPTASGKTGVAAKLSEQFGVELVSVDAAQVYRGMNIGTAKPDQDFLNRYPHHLIDIRQPDQGFNAADFVEYASGLIRDIHDRGRIPLLVGGTMFYFNALERGLSALPPASSAIRRQIEKEIRQAGVGPLHDELCRIDPGLGRRIDRHDRQRVQRALEIYRLTGGPPSELMGNARGLANKPLKLTLFTADRSRLHDRIARRFEQMIEQGLIDEVASLVSTYPAFADSPAGRIVGYRQVLQHLSGSLDSRELIQSGVAATRQLAKRQLTWLRQQSGVVWFDANFDSIVLAVTTYLRHHPSIPPS